MEGICKKGLRLRIERIDRDGAIAEPFIEDRFFEVIVHEVRPKVDEEERAERPCHKHDRTKCEQMFVLHMRCHFTSTTGGTLYSPSRMAAPGTYTRSQSMKLPEGAGSQLDSWPGGAVFWM